MHPAIPIKSLLYPILKSAFQNLIIWLFPDSCIHCIFKNGTSSYTFASGKIIIRTPQALSTFPLYPDTSQMRRSVLRGKRFVEKVLDTGKKVIPFVALIRRKSGTAPLREQLFCLSPPDLYFFHVLYLTQPVETSPCSLNHLPDPFRSNHFLRKQSSGI